MPIILRPQATHHSCLPEATWELSDKDLLEIFLQPENVHLYQDIETVMSVMVKAALLISVETWISTMEHHSSQRRTMGDGGDVT